MLTSLLLAGAVAASPIGLSASPAAFETAQANHTYTINVTDSGRVPEVVRASLAPAALERGKCAVDLASSISWARVVGRTTFRLVPHQTRAVRIRVAQPPTGKSEINAVFLTAAGKRSGVTTSAGIAAALRFSEPGRTAVNAVPCPRPKVTHPHVAAAAAVADPPSGIPAWAYGAIGAVLASITAAGLSWLRRRGWRRDRQAPMA